MIFINRIANTIWFNNNAENFFTSWHGFVYIDKINCEASDAFMYAYKTDGTI